MSSHYHFLPTDATVRPRAQSGIVRFPKMSAALERHVRPVRVGIPRHRKANRPMVKHRVRVCHLSEYLFEPQWRIPLEPRVDGARKKTRLRPARERRQIIVQPIRVDEHVIV